MIKTNASSTMFNDTRTAEQRLRTQPTKSAFRTFIKKLAEAMYMLA